MPINLASYIQPRNATNPDPALRNTYYLLEDIYVKGGYQIRADVLERDAINPLNMKPGMLVYTLAENKIWILGSDGTSWAEFKTGGGSLFSSNSIATLNYANPQGATNNSGYLYDWGNTGSYGAASAIHRIFIGKGAVPTQSEIDAFSNTNYNTESALPRYADSLIILQCVNYQNLAVANTIKLALTPSVARQAGTATWFMLMSSGVFQYYLSPYTNFIQRTAIICGTISDLAGAGDIKLTTTNIIAGSLYKIPAISLPLPTKLSW